MWELALQSVAAAEAAYRPLLREFVDWARSERGLQPSSIHQSVSYIRRFLDWIPVGEDVLAAFRGLTPDRNPGWETFYPRPGRPWAGWVSRPGGRREHGLYDPAVDRFTPVAPRNDPELPALGAWCGRGELLAYRPGRRAVVRFTEGGETRYAKVLRPRPARRLVERTGQLAAARNGLPAGFPALPAMLRFEPATGVVVFRELEGVSLHAILLHRPGARKDALDTVARGLVAFHAAAAPAGLPAARTGPRLERWVALVVRAFPWLEAPYREALGRMPAAEPVEPAPAGPARGGRLIHGDLHDKNILVAGPRIGLLDLEALGRGDPAADVGNLAAHLVLRALQAGGDPGRAGRADAQFLHHAYRVHGGRTDPAAVARHFACTLFRLACLYRFRRRWQPLTPALLEAAARGAELGC